MKYYSLTKLIAVSILIGAAYTHVTKNIYIDTRLPTITYKYNRKTRRAKK